MLRAREAAGPQPSRKGRHLPIAMRYRSKTTLSFWSPPGEALAERPATMFPDQNSHAPTVDEPGLDEMRQDCVGQQERRHDGPI
jgi:hypothetical protein